MAAVAAGAATATATATAAGAGAAAAKNNNDTKTLAAARREASCGRAGGPANASHWQLAARLTSRPA